MKVYCNQCKKEIEPKGNKCPNCGLAFEEDIITNNVGSFGEDNDVQSKNVISQILKGIGWIIVVGGLILGFSYGIEIGNKMGFMTFLIVVTSYFVVSMLFFSISEIIQILHDIRNKIYNKK